MLRRVWKPIALDASETSQVCRTTSSTAGPAGARPRLANRGRGIQNARDTRPQPLKSTNPYIASMPAKNSTRAMPRSVGLDGLNQKRVHPRTGPTSVSSHCDVRPGDDLVNQLHMVRRIDVFGLRVELPVRVVDPDCAKRRTVVRTAFALHLVTRQRV